METDKPLVPKTLRHYVNAARSVLVWAFEHEWIRRLPRLPNLDAPEQRERDADETTPAAAFAKLPQRAGRTLRFQLETMARPGEVCRLQWSHVELNRNRCVMPAKLHKTGRKVGKPRVLYLIPAAVEILRELRAQSDGACHVFRSRFGKPYTAAGLRSILCKHTGLTPYQLRHSAAQAEVDAGRPLEEVAAELGHADLRMVKTYAAVRENRLRNRAQVFKLDTPKAG